MQRGLRLEYLSLGWNAIAGTAAMVTGLSTASVALLGFGLDVAIDSAFLPHSRLADLSRGARKRAK